MKTLVITCLLMVIFGSVCSAENWQYVGEYNSTKMYLDTDSISFRVTPRHDFYKARIRLELSENTSNVEYISVNSDTQEYSPVSLEVYKNNVKTLSVAYETERWYEKSFQNMDLLVDKIISIGEQKRGGK